jgi:hypothetical protein
MSIHFEYDSTYGILRAQINDPFDLEEYREALIQITSGVHYSATVPAIWDLRKLNFSDLESRLAYYVKEIRSSFKIRRNAKIAYVVSSQLGYGLMRMLQVVTDTEESSLVCYEYDEAEKWIKDVAQSHPQKRS